MPQDLRTIRRKIRTVTNVAQITRAMKMVAAARLRRSQQIVADCRAYWEGVRQMTSMVICQFEEIDHPFLSTEPPQRVALLVVAGDRGLCGSYNSLVFRRAAQALDELPVALVIGVGEKTRSWAASTGFSLYEVFPGFGGRTTGTVDLQVGRLLESLIAQGVCDGIYAVHTPYRSALYNIADVSRVLPMTVEGEATARRVPYLFEPDPRTVVEALLPRAFQTHLSQIIIESAAAEQAARVAAMTAASDNAEDLMQELIRLRNRVRQQEITTEILEVVSGAEAISAD